MSELADYEGANIIDAVGKFGAAHPRAGLGGSFDGGDGGMEAWRQSVEARLSEIKQDIRELRQWIVYGAVGLVTAFAAGWVVLSQSIQASELRLSDQISGVSTQLSENGVRDARIEALLETQAEPQNERRR